MSNPDDFTVAFNAYHKAATEGTPANAFEAEYPEYADTLPTLTVEKIYRYAPKPNKSVSKTETPTGNIKFTIDKNVNAKKLSSSDKAAIAALRKIAAVLKKNIVVYASETGANGYYDPSENEFGVNLLGDYSIIQTMGHELTHFIREKNEAGYQALKDFLLEKYKLVEDGDAVDDLVKEQQEMARNSKEKPRELSYDDALEEVVADACQNMLKDSTAIQELAQQNPGLFKTIKKWIDDFVKSIKEAFAGADTMSKSREWLVEADKDMSELQRIFDKALVGAAGAATPSAANTKYSLRKTRHMSWEEQINGYLYEKRVINRGDTLSLGATPAYLTKDGIDNLPLAIPLSVITKARSGKDADHIVADDNLKKLIAGVSDSIVTIDNPERNSILFITKIEQDNKLLVMSFDKNAIFDGDKVHKATSIHLRSDIAPLLYSLKGNATIYIHNNNELDITSRSSIDLERVQSKIKFIDIIKPQDSVDVKEKSEKFSRKDSSRVSRDAEYFTAVNNGDMESAQKMADEAAKENGYAIKAYHGTAFDFTVFEREKIGSNYGADSEGFFFTNDYDDADGVAYDARINWLTKYGDSNDDYSDEIATDNGVSEIVLGVYLKMDNPLVIISTPDKNGYAEISGYMDDNRNKVWGEYIRGDKNGDDYDGIIIKGDNTYKKSNNFNANHECYIVTDSSKIKSAAPATYKNNGDIIPLSKRFDATEDDIRYSDRLLEPHSKRKFLADALSEYENASEKDRAVLDKYRAKTGELDALQAQLDDVNKQIHNISFNKGTDRSLLPDLNKTKDQLAKKINAADKKLLDLESMEVVDHVLKYAVKAQYKKGRADLQEYKAERRTTAEKRKMLAHIEYNVSDLTQVVDTVFHRPQGMRSQDTALKSSIYSFASEPMKRLMSSYGENSAYAGFFSYIFDLHLTCTFLLFFVYYRCESLLSCICENP